MEPSSDADKPKSFEFECPQYVDFKTMDLSQGPDDSWFDSLPPEWERPDEMTNLRERRYLSPSLPPVTTPKRNKAKGFIPRGSPLLSKVLSNFLIQILC